MSPQDRRTDMLRHFPTLLARWAGATARMCEMTHSHPTLKIELWHPDRKGRLLISCICPEFIHGPTVWSDAHIVVGFADADSWIVSDERADMRIRAGSVG